MFHIREGWFNICIQFARTLVVLLTIVAFLVVLPILLLFFILWFVWKNVKYSASIHKLPAVTTDVITNAITRKFASPFVRYLGWFCQNYIFERFLKALKQNRATLKDARHTVHLVKTLVRQMNQVDGSADKLDAGEEFKKVSYGQFKRRNKGYWSSRKGMVITGPMQCASLFLFSINESDEQVFYVAARQVFNFIRKIPYVGKWKWVNKGLSAFQETLYLKKFRRKLREEMDGGVRVYVDNMMRACMDYGALNVIDAWSIVMKDWADLVAIEPSVENEARIAKSVAIFVGHANEAGRQTFVAMVQNDGFKIAQDDYIDVTIESCIGDGQYVGPVVYVEGRTDEKYFNRALKAYGFNVRFQYSWIGRLDERGNEVNTGAGALKNAASLYSAHNPPDRTVIQFDCDQPHKETKVGTLLIRSVARYENTKGCVSGVENALVLDGIDQKRWDSFFDVRVVQNVYGKAGQKYDLQKMKLCEYICALPDEACRKIFKNLKSEIEKVSVWFEVE